MPAKHQVGGVDIRVLLEIELANREAAACTCMYAMIFSFASALYLLDR